MPRTGRTLGTVGEGNATYPGDVDATPPPLRYLTDAAFQAALGKAADVARCIRTTREYNPPRCSAFYILCLVFPVECGRTQQVNEQAYRGR